MVLFGAVVGSAAKARPVLEEFLATAAPGVDLEELTELSPRAAPCRHSYAGRPEPTMIEPGPPAAVRPRLRAVKSEFFDQLMPREVIEALVTTFDEDRPDMQYRELELVPWGGAFAQVAPEETAFAHRRQRFMLGHHAIVPNMVGDDGRTEALEWVRRSWQTVHPFASGAVYPNYPDRELAGWARAYYGDNLPRLSAVKQQYDPYEAFRFPQSVPLPDAAGG